MISILYFLANAVIDRREGGLFIFLVCPSAVWRMAASLQQLTQNLKNIMCPSQFRFTCAVSHQSVSVGKESLLYLHQLTEELRQTASSRSLTSSWRGHHLTFLTLSQCLAQSGKMVSKQPCFASSSSTRTFL